MRSHKMTKRRKLALLSALTIMLCLAPAAKAENGRSTAVLTTEAPVIRSECFSAAKDEVPVLLMPKSLTRIGEGAFEGSASECVVISENVTAIEKNQRRNDLPMQRDLPSMIRMLIMRSPSIRPDTISRLNSLIKKAAVPAAFSA